MNEFVYDYSLKRKILQRSTSSVSQKIKQQRTDDNAQLANNNYITPGKDLETTRNNINHVSVKIK